MFLTRQRLALGDHDESDNNNWHAINLAEAGAVKQHQYLLLFLVAIQFYFPIPDLYGGKNQNRK